MPNPFDFLNWLKREEDKKATKMSVLEAERRRVAQQAASKPINLDFLSPLSKTKPSLNLGGLTNPAPQKGFSQFRIQPNEIEQERKQLLTLKQEAAKTYDKYKVVPGDFLSGISQKLGVEDWMDIYQANRDVIGNDPDLIHPNQEFMIPRKTLQKVNGNAHKVSKGESLSRIAQEYGIEDWRELYEMNKDIIGKNPNMINPGTVLRLPNGNNKSLMDDFSEWQKGSAPKKSLVGDFNDWQSAKGNGGSFLDNIKRKKAQQQGQYDFGWIDEYQFPSQKKESSFLDTLKQNRMTREAELTQQQLSNPAAQTSSEQMRRAAAQKNELAMDKRLTDDDRKLIEAGLPRSSELPKGLSVDFAINNPGFTRFMLKATNPIRNFMEDTTTGKIITRAGQTAGDVATAGASAIGREQKASTGNNVVDKTIDVVGMIGGFLARPGGVPSYNQSGNLMAKKIEQMVTEQTPNRAAQVFFRGAGGGIPFAVADQFSNRPDRSLGERVNDFATDVALGAGAELGLKYAGNGIKKGINSIKKLASQSNQQPKIEGLDFSTLPKTPARTNLPKIDMATNPANKLETFLSSLPKPQQKMEPSFKNEVGGMLDDIFGPSKTQAVSNMAEPNAKLLSTNMLSSLQPKKAATQKSLDDLLLDVGNADTFRNKINRNPKVKRPFKEFAEKFRIQFVDELAPLEKLEKSMLGSLPSAENSLYKKARLFRGSPAKAHEIVRTKLAPIIETVENKGYSYKDLGDYALAVHANDVNNMGIKSGFSNKEIEAVIQKYGTPEIESARQQLMKVSEDLLNTLSDSGVISKDLVAHLHQKYPNYMPLFRSFDDDKVDFAGALSDSLANVTNPLKRLKGSEKDVIDPLESMVKNIFQATNTADRNQVARQLGRLADQDVDGNFVRRLASGEKEGRKNVVSVLENGERIKFEVQPDVYRAMLSLDKESSNMIINLLSKPASTLRAGATLTPEFSMRNWMRDVPTAYIVSQSGFNPLIDFPIAVLETIFKDKPIYLFGKQISSGQLYSQFIKDNAGYGNIVSMDRQVHQEALRNVLKEPTSKKFINVVNPKKWLEVLRAIADVSETSTKMGEYRAALRKGTSREEAAYRARDIMDFARAGSGVRNWNKMTAFLNANIQGKSKILRSASENPASVTVKALTAITLPTIAVKVAQEMFSSDQQKETIKDSPAWLKNSFWLIPVPGTDQVARIPKPFDLAPIFANLPERLMEYVIENDFDGFVKESLSSLTIPVMMTGLTPIVEGFANYSFFRQGPIIPMREERLNYPDQYDVNTSEAAKLIGKGVNTLTDGEGAFKNFGSPRIIDNTIRGLGGGLAGYATDGIDGVLQALGAVGNKPEKANKPFDQSPFARAFLVNQSQGGASLDRLYNERDRLRRAEGSAKMQDGQLSPEDKRNLKYIEKVLDGISKINSQIREIENHPTMSGAEKQRRLDELYKKRQEIARGASGKLGW